MKLNELRTANYLLSAPNLTHCPEDEGHEVAFAGRSNAGKSSCLNLVAGQKSLARVSKTPGRTQLINFFTLTNPLQKLVDLPGYGFAKVPDAMRANWGRDIQGYLTLRQALKGLVLLSDIRHPMRELDVQMVDWCVARELPVQVVLTKGDKLSKNQANQTLFAVRKALPEGCGVQVFSALKGTGLETLQAVLCDWLRLPPEDAAESAPK